MHENSMHKPVLLHESVDALNLGPGKTFLDGTLGSGGHTREVLRRFPGVRVIGLDQDPEAIKRNLDLDIETRLSNFSNLDHVLAELNTKPDAILLDLGFSSDQLEGSSDPTLPGRGFSFQRDEPLDMRMSGEDLPTHANLTAANILNSWDEHAIELILRGFGEEKLSRKIAREIIERREVRPFKTTFDLVEAVLAVKPKRMREKIHPATKTFQALRIAVNRELVVLEEALDKGTKILKPHGRFAVISFHSLEDRIVKNFFRDKAKSGEGTLITKKPITASREEIEENPRSRSAKLRILEKNV